MITDTQRNLTGLVALATCLLIVSGQAAIAQTPTAGSLTVDPERFSGTDANGRLLIYAPNPVEPGSSISHFDSSAFPSLLMEPGISSDLPPLGLDVTAAAMRDIGWSTGQSVFSLNFTDPAGQGFNHPTLGAQRRTALQQAANVFGSTLRSSVTINIDARFQSLTCSSTDGATLAQALASFVFTVPTAAEPGSWYPGALAEALSGQNLSLANNPNPSAGDLRITFNSQIDNSCLGTGRTYFYGTGEEASGQIHFINVALHEIGHGIGFATFINATTGQQFNGRPDIYSHFLRDTVLRKDWAELTPAQVAASATRSGRLVWTGSRTNQAAQALLDPAAVFVIQPPSTVAGAFDAGVAQFGPRVSNVMPTGKLVLARDASASPSLLCGPVVNRHAVSGNIAVVDRGDCTFVSKVLSAQDAGAIGVLVINNTSGILTMGGDNTSVQIPSLLVSDADGVVIRRAINNPQDTDPMDPDDPDDPPPPPPPPPPPELTEGIDGPTDAPSVCVENATSLCLATERFRVNVDFSTVDQTDAQAQAIALTEDTGYFWFFNEANVEIVIKVLNGCGINQRFWVFSGGLTDVDVEIKVVDTETGASRIYQSSDRAFLPVQDVEAFASCPLEP